MKQIVLTMMALATICTQTATAQTRVSNLYTETQSLKIEKVQDTANPVQVNRYLFAGYNTLCLPMSMSGEQLAERGITAERLTAIHQEGTTLQLHFVDCTNEGIEAGVPYLIYSSKSQYLRLKNTEAGRINTELKTIRMSDGQGNQVAFSSSWDAKQKDGLYGIPAKQNVTPLESVLVRTTADLSFLPTRCGFSWEQQAANAERLEIIHATGSEITAIKQMNSNSNASTDVYDLQGRKVNGNARGLTIQNGKKVIR